MNARPLLLVACVPALVLAAPAFASAAEPAGLDFARLAALRQVTSVEISPDGRLVAYVLGVPRRPGRDDNGPEWAELHLVPFEGGPDRPYVHGEVNVSAIRFSADSSEVTYLAKRGKGDEAKTALWSIPVAGGESRQLVTHGEDIERYRVSPDGRHVAFVALEPESKTREKAKKKGYKQEVFEEDFRPRRLWIAELSPAAPPVLDPAAAAPEPGKPRALSIDGSVFDLDWSPDGKRLLVSVAPRPLIDDRMMLRRVRVVDAETGGTLASFDNPGKLGEFAWSPDGSQIAMITADDVHDPAEGRLKVAPASGGPLRDLLPGFEGHVTHFAWQDPRTLSFVADVGVETLSSEVDLGTREHTVRARSGKGAPVLTSLSLSDIGRRATFVGQTPGHPGEVFVTARGEGPRRLTTSNPWLADVTLAPQEAIRFTARDGVAIEGLLLRPLGSSAAAGRAPLLLMVHGGPESHDRNGWVTSYSRPGQIAAASGYAVFYPNYRGSTGRGVAFSKLGQGDPAGREFDDLIDAVDHLVQLGVADRERVGITGGSYGGYATAWCATRHTERFRAGVMMVGISDTSGKALTTEIPLEDKLVHTLSEPWESWDLARERSPLYHAEHSRTALLIAGGKDDTRVDPSQSLALYRALKLMGKTPVRYVRYPGEGHGNRSAAARDDYARRLMAWMNHFVRDRGTELPPWEIEPDLDDEEQE